MVPLHNRVNLLTLTRKPPLLVLGRPVGLGGPLQVWLSELTGLPARASFVAYGTVVAELERADSPWNSSRGINVLVARSADLCRAEPLSDWAELAEQAEV